ncbi:MAG: hypothetical protein Q9182_004250, partial [Xanthomendoza sp. 2 TL-2023]
QRLANNPSQDWLQLLEDGVLRAAPAGFNQVFTGMSGSDANEAAKPIHELDIPAFDWPAAPSPKLKHPLEQHHQENTTEEDRRLHETENLIQTIPNPVAAVIVEPIRSKGGDNHASPRFFQALRNITRHKNTLLIIDEVHIGVSTTGNP